jgi:hypothetical protein
MLDFSVYRYLIHAGHCTEEDLLLLVDYCEYCEEVTEQQKETIDALTYYIESALGEVISE